VVSKKLLLVFVFICSLSFIRAVYANPVLVSDSAIVFAFALLVTIFIEAYGLWFLLKSLNLLKEESRFTRLQCLGIAVLLNVVTFLIGNFLLLPLLGY